MGNPVLTRTLFIVKELGHVNEDTLRQCVVTVVTFVMLMQSIYLNHFDLCFEALLLICAIAMSCFQGGSNTHAMNAFMQHKDAQYESENVLYHEYTELICIWQCHHILAQGGFERSRRVKRSLMKTLPPCGQFPTTTHR